MTNAENPIEGFLELLSVLAERNDIAIIFTHPNTDHGRSAIVKGIKDFVLKHSNRSMDQDSLGQLKFLSALKYVDAMVGNSSSGIIEAPSMSVPSLNIGNRQKGRYQASTVIDCKSNENDIFEGLEKVLSRNKDVKVENPYSLGNPANTVISILERLDL